VFVSNFIYNFKTKCESSSHEHISCVISHIFAVVFNATWWINLGW